MTLYTVKYAPATLDEIYGQDKAVTKLKNFVGNYKQQKNKAVLLYGPIGCGKTSSVYALAKELNYDLLEINSSDLRNEKNMKSFLNSATGQMSLFFKPKIILIDEIDNVSGVKDRGAIPAFVKAIVNSSFPIILTSNESPYENSKLKALKKVCDLIEYEKLPTNLVSNVLKITCQKEGITYEDKAINKLSWQTDGDLRGALIDLQACVIKNNFTHDDIMGLSDRKRTDSIKNALMIIFKSSSVENAIKSLNNVDVDINEVFLWLDENLPKEYTSPKSLAKAYEYMARADVFRGRIRKRQHWRFLSYVNNFVTAGISSAKVEKSPNMIEYKRSMRPLRIWQSNMKNAKKKDIAVKLAIATHTSKKVAMSQIPFFQEMFRKGSSIEIKKIAEELELSSDEVVWLKK